MALSIGLWLKRKRGMAGGSEQDYDHLLTAAETVICTAAGTRIALQRGKRFILTANKNRITTAADTALYN